MKEITRVYTKYDVMPNLIRTLQERKWEDMSNGGTMMREVDYHAVQVLKGLEGLTYVTYQERS